MKYFKPKPVQCGACPNCQGSTVLRNIVIDKRTSTIIDKEDCFRFLCSNFGYVCEDSLCFSIRPTKEITVYEAEWVEQ